jgi:hypothetical protein
MSAMRPQAAVRANACGNDDRRCGDRLPEPAAGHRPVYTGICASCARRRTATEAIG